MVKPPINKLPTLSLKQFMLRSEIIKLYRDFMKLGRHLDSPPKEFSSSTTTTTTTSPRTEWQSWVRSEFRLRIESPSSSDEQVAAALIKQGKRQLEEMTRTIALATNTNVDPEKFKKQ